MLIWKDMKKFNFIKKIGIDLGTSNTIIFVPNKGIVLNEASVIAISKIGNKILAIGNKAKDMIGKSPEEIIAFKPIQNGRIIDYQAVEIMLKYYIEKVIPRFNFFKPDVVVSISSSANGIEKKSVVDAILKAGGKSAYLSKETILSAIGCKIPIWESVGRLIVNIGGGVTDVSVICLGGVVASNSIKCGGEDMDKSILEYIKKNHHLSIGEHMAEEIKKDIGSALQIEVEEEKEIQGIDIKLGLPRILKIKTNEITISIEKELKQIVLCIKSVLHNTPPEIAKDIIENGIIMTGGGSLLKHFSVLVENKIGVKTILAEDPLFSVIKGTEVVLNNLDIYNKNVIKKK